jgi:hypothetical protein
MANISQIKLPNNVTYDLVDKGARDLISAGVSFVKVNSFSDLPTASVSTVGKIYLVPDTHSDSNDIYDEYITVESGTSTYIWEKIGNTDIDLSDYSTKTHTHTVTANVTLTGANYTPSGTVSQPTFNGNSMTLTGTFTPGGTVSQPTFNGNSMTLSANYTPNGTVSSTFTGNTATISMSGTPSGTVSKPTISITNAGGTAQTLYSMSSAGSYTASSFSAGTTPCSYAVSNEVLVISYGTAPSYTKENVTLPTRVAVTVDVSQPTFTGNLMTLSTNYTPAGTVSSKFTGNSSTISVTGTPSGTVTKPTFTGNSGTISVTGTPSGTVSKPTFTGTAATIKPTITSSSVTTSQASS